MRNEGKAGSELSFTLFLISEHFLLIIVKSAYSNIHLVI